MTSGRDEPLTFSEMSFVGVTLPSVADTWGAMLVSIGWAVSRLRGSSWGPFLSGPLFRGPLRLAMATTELDSASFHRVVFATAGRGRAELEMLVGLLTCDEIRGRHGGQSFWPRPAEGGGRVWGIAVSLSCRLGKNRGRSEWVVVARCSALECGWKRRLARGCRYSTRRGRRLCAGSLGSLGRGGQSGRCFKCTIGRWVLVIVHAFGSTE